MPKNISTEINKEYFLVCVDESNEFYAALEYACVNAQKQKINLILLYIIEIANFRHWKGVETIMQEEQKSKAKELLNIHLAEIKKNYKLKIKTMVKRGDRVETILKVLKNNNVIGSKRSFINVSKSGLGERVYLFATKSGLSYGIIAVIAAMLFGFLVNEAIRKINA